jgi:hypothetical protein
MLFTTENQEAECSKRPANVIVLVSGPEPELIRINTVCSMSFIVRSARMVSDRDTLLQRLSVAVAVVCSTYTCPVHS